MYWTKELRSEEQAQEVPQATYHPNHGNRHSIGLWVSDEFPLQLPYSFLFHGRWGAEKHVLQRTRISLSVVSLRGAKKKLIELVTIPRVDAKVTIIYFMIWISLFIEKSSKQWEVAKFVGHRKKKETVKMRKSFQLEILAQKLHERNSIQKA